MDQECEHCGSLHFAEERVSQPPHFVLCCHNGKTKNMQFDDNEPGETTPLPLPPAYLYELLTGTRERRGTSGRTPDATTRLYASCPSGWVASHK